jgi:glutamyl-tRNA synthetase
VIDPSVPARVRFCPAPSGWLHVGGARTALFNWLWARRTGGALVLRIEDTDADRATLSHAEGMLEALAWLGLDWDEGPAIGRFPERGAHGPYLQSARRALHQAVARRLHEAGHAYEAFETAEELEAARAAGRHVYKRATSATAAADGRPGVLRIATPEDGEVAFDDAVRGRVLTRWAEVADPVVLRADGTPTYLLANVVDDLAQGIGVIARGEDLLAATPRQLLLTELLLPTGILDAALDEVGAPPRPAGAPDRLAYAHLPLLVGADRKKLSKRHGDVAIGAFEQAGFLPEAMVGFLALCGWSPGGDRERMTRDELVAAFSFDRVQPSPAHFDVDKLRALNGEAIRAADEAELAAMLLPAFRRAGLVGDPPSPRERALVEGVAPLVRERAPTLDEAVPFVAFAFRDEVAWDAAAVARWLKPPAAEVLDDLLPRLAAAEPWDAARLLAAFEEVAAAREVGIGKVMQPVRVLLTGTAVSPPLPETMAVLDRGWVLDRLADGRRLLADGALPGLPPA